MEGAGSSEGVQHLLVVVVDINDAYDKSLVAEDLSQRVRLTQADLLGCLLAGV